MRTTLLSFAAAAAVLSATTLTSTRAEAMTVGSAAALQQAIQDASNLQEVAVVCSHRYYTSGRRCRTVLVCRHRAWTSSRRCY